VAWKEIRLLLAIGEALAWSWTLCPVVVVMMAKVMAMARARLMVQESMHPQPDSQKTPGLCCPF
jgi:hypothetical protein